MMRAISWFLALVTAFAAPCWASDAPPKMAIANFEQLARPLPLPYNEKADANRAVAKAIAKAAAGHKRLLIEFGGNWCLDCRILAGTFGTEPLKAWLTKHYEVVTVDVGRFDRNMQIPARFGITGGLEGVPALLIIDPPSKKLINAGHVTALADARSMNPQALADWLAQWAR